MSCFKSQNCNLNSDNITTYIFIYLSSNRFTEICTYSIMSIESYLE